MCILEWTFQNAIMNVQDAITYYLKERSKNVKIFIQVFFDCLKLILYKFLQYIYDLYALDPFISCILLGNLVLSILRVMTFMKMIWEIIVNRHGFSFVLIFSLCGFLFVSWWDYLAAKKHWNPLPWLPIDLKSPGMTLFSRSKDHSSIHQRWKKKLVKCLFRLSSSHVLENSTWYHIVDFFFLWISF